MIHNNVIYSKALKRAEIDYFNIYNIDSKLLMKNAANALLSVIIERIDPNSIICFVCGSGNNGGDGYACADILNEMGYNTFVVCNKLPQTDDSEFFYRNYVKNGGNVFEFSNEEIIFEKVSRSDVIVDCLYGIGFHGSLDEFDSSLITICNDSGAFIISCDIPSGTEADTAEVELAICADITVVFTSLKAANVSYPALEYNGQVILKDIGIPKEVLDNINDDDIIILATENSVITPKRFNNSHKGSYGKVAMYCGSENMIGAAIFAIKSALRLGVGLIEVCSERKALNKLQQILSEPIYSELTTILPKADSYLIGCGIGRSMDDYIEYILTNTEKSIVIDADGINYISSHINVLRNMTANKILTPHPAEMARLLGTTVKDVNFHRIAYTQKFAKEFNCVVVLKGARTIIASPNKLAINMSGSDSLAKGGSGDMLAGIISAYLAQGVLPFDAAVSGCYAHGKLGEACNYQETISEMIEKL